MRGMMTDDLNAAIHTYLTTVPASGFAGREVRMAECWRGAENLLWRVGCAGQEAAVKLFLDAGQARGRRQFDGQQLFAAAGIAPAPLWFDRYPAGLARQVLVYRWADGEGIAATEEAMLAQLAGVAATIHSHPAGDIRRFCPRPVNLDYFWRVVAGGIEPVQRWCTEVGCDSMAALVEQLGGRAVAVVEQGLPLWQVAPPTPVHGDLSLANALAVGGAVMLVDWEMFGLGDPALEVASFLHDSRSALSAALLAGWREQYLAASSDSQIARRIEVYEQLLPLQQLLFLLNGLRRLTAAERADSAYHSRRSFLAETLQIATDAAQVALDTVPPDAGGVLSGEVQRLTS